MTNSLEILEKNGHIKQESFVYEIIRNRRFNRDAYIRYIGALSKLKKSLDETEVLDRNMISYISTVYIYIFSEIILTTKLYSQLPEYQDFMNPGSKIIKNMNDDVFQYYICILEEAMFKVIETNKIELLQIEDANPNINLQLDNYKLKEGTLIKSMISGSEAEKSFREFIKSLRKLTIENKDKKECEKQELYLIWKNISNIYKFLIRQADVLDLKKEMILKDMKNEDIYGYLNRLNDSFLGYVKGYVVEDEQYEDEVNIE